MLWWQLRQIRSPRNASTKSGASTAWTHWPANSRCTARCGGGISKLVTHNAVCNVPTAAASQGAPAISRPGVKERTSCLNYGDYQTRSSGTWYAGSL
jgi:hypothetical protein